MPRPEPQPPPTPTHFQSNLTKNDHNAQRHHHHHRHQQQQQHLRPGDRQLIFFFTLLFKLAIITSTIGIFYLISVQYQEDLVRYATAYQKAHPNGQHRNPHWDWPPQSMSFPSSTRGTGHVMGVVITDDVNTPKPNAVVAGYININTSSSQSHQSTPSITKPPTIPTPIQHPKKTQSQSNASGNEWVDSKVKMQPQTLTTKHHYHNHNPLAGSTIDIIPPDFDTHQSIKIHDNVTDGKPQQNKEKTTNQPPPSISIPLPQPNTESPSTPSNPAAISHQHQMEASNSALTVNLSTPTATRSTTTSTSSTAAPKKSTLEREQPVLTAKELELPQAIDNKPIDKDGKHPTVANKHNPEQKQTDKQQLPSAATMAGTTPSTTTKTTTSLSPNTIGKETSKSQSSTQSPPKTPLTSPPIVPPAIPPATTNSASQTSLVSTPKQEIQPQLQPKTHIDNDKDQPLSQSPPQPDPQSPSPPNPPSQPVPKERDVTNFVSIASLAVFLVSALLGYQSMIHLELNRVAT